MFSLYSLGPLVLSPWGPCYKLNCMVVIRTLATAAIYFSLARMRVLIEGGSYYFRVVHKATQSSCQPRKQVLQHVRLYSLRIAQWAPRAGIISTRVRVPHVSVLGTIAWAVYHDSLAQSLRESRAVPLLSRFSVLWVCPWYWFGDPTNIYMRKWHPKNKFPSQPIINRVLLSTGSLVVP